VPPTRRESGSARYFDHEGQATDNPAAAVEGQVLEYDSRGRAVRRTRFFLAERELPWLPVGEAAFLLWVLAVLAVVWLIIGVVLQLT
jgi:hypothetical protein